VLSALMPSFGEAQGLANLVMLAVGMGFVVKLRGRVRFKTLIWVLIVHFPLIYLLARFVAADPNGIMQTLLGIALIVLAVYMVFFQSKLHIRMTPASGLITGAATGLFGGLFCMAGVPMAVYLLSMDDKDDYFATIQTFFAVTAVYAVFVHGINGFLTREVFAALPLSLVGALIGSVLGKRIFDRIDQTTLKRIVYAFMVVSGISLILS